MTEERKHSADIRLRVIPEHDRLFRDAAEHAGLNLSSWLRQIALRAARKELSEEPESQQN